MDGQLFHDAQFMLQKARAAHGDAKSQRELPPTRYRVLHTLLGHRFPDSDGVSRLNHSLRFVFRRCIAIWKNACR